MDDTFVLVSAFQHEDISHLSARDRVPTAMARAGTSITVTSLTDVVAFLAGSYTSIPVVRAFCQYAAIGVTMDFFLQITFFTAAMYMSAQREEKDRYDWLCCITSSKPDSQCYPKNKPFDQDKPEMMTVFLRDVYGPRLLSTPGKVIALSIGAALLGLNIWACTQVSVDFVFECQFRTFCLLHISAVALTRTTLPPCILTVSAFSLSLTQITPLTLVPKHTLSH